MATKKTDHGELLKVDLHNLALWQAKEKIRDELNIAAERGLAGLYLIHGFNGGDRIRSHIREGPLSNSLNDRKIDAKIVSDRKNLGASAIIFSKH